MKKIIYLLGTCLCINLGIILFIFQYKELKRESLNTKKIELSDSITLITKEVDSLNLEYDSKPLGFDNLVKDLYATYSITLTENEYNDILAVYKNRHIDWLDSFYLKKTTKRLTPERLAYIRKKYLGLDIQLVENELLKKEIDLRLRKISSLTIKKKEVEKNIYNKFNVKAYSIITIIIWTLIILPIAFLVSSFLKKKKTQQPT